MSTVHICLNDIFGVAVACEVIFYPGDTPFFNGPALAVSGACSTRLDAEGNGSVTLLPGRYAVRFSGITSNTDTLLILVPTDEGDYPLSALICGGNWVLPLRDFLQKSSNLGDVADPAAAFAAIKQAATPAASGVVCLATQAEVDAGNDAAKAVTPATLAHTARWASAGGGGKLVTVPNAAGRFSLTPQQVAVGDLVEQLDTRAVFQVLDSTALAHEWGYVSIGTRPDNEGGSGPVLTSGLAAYWKLDEQSGVRVDSTGNGNDLSDVGTVGYAAGKIGNAALFNGGNYLSLSTNYDQTDISGGGSLSCWFNPSALSSNQIVACWGPGSGTFRVCIDPTGLLEINFACPAVGDLQMTTPYALTGGQWHHVAFVFDKANALVRAYLEGVQFAVGSLPYVYINGPLSIGQDGYYDGYFSGSIDEVGLWTRALSDAEITRLYNNGNGLAYPFA